VIHPRQHITDLAAICRHRGIRNIIISPGSRSAPLIQAFYRYFGDACISLVDERSAAFFGLGIAAATRQPVVLVCTSGTAALNYAPALAEAYYQQVPLIAVTADRPREWIDQQDNQTLRQGNLYTTFTKGQFELPRQMQTADDLWYAHRTVNWMLSLCLQENPGPVHLNVPLTEPLYAELPPVSARLPIVPVAELHEEIKLARGLEETWARADRILIVHGQDHPGSRVGETLAPLLSDSRITVLAENISQVSGKDVIGISSLLLMQHKNNNLPSPDLVIHTGGHVVSKALTGYLRRAADFECWRAGRDTSLVDTFQKATLQIAASPAPLYQALSKIQPYRKESGYRQQWLQAQHESLHASANFIKSIRFSDLAAFGLIMDHIPAKATVMLGNSSIIRYAQLFPSQAGVTYLANRGVSGIDGCLSTSAGAAFSEKAPAVAILGDLGFLYDSNGLWNRELPANLRIIVINNKGGGIFHILKGPADYPGFAQFVEAHHPVNIHTLASAFGLSFTRAENSEELSAVLPDFMHGTGSASLLEISTDASVSAAMFRQLMGISL